jgi:hypothetical protein
MLANDRFFMPTVELKDQHSNLVQRDFMKALFTKSNEKCKEFLGDLNGDDNRTCRNEVMVAASCVLLYKTNNNVGDYRDNVGLCKHEIELSKKYLKEKWNDFPEVKLDDWLRGLSLSTKSFV